MHTLENAFTGRQRPLRFTANFSFPVGARQEWVNNVGRRARYQRTGSIRAVALGYVFTVSTGLRYQTDNLGRTFIQGFVGYTIDDNSEYAELFRTLTSVSQWIYNGTPFDISGLGSSGFDAVVTGSIEFEWNVAQKRLISGLIPADTPYFPVLNAGAGANGYPCNKVVTYETLRQMTDAVKVTVNVSGLPSTSFTHTYSNPNDMLPNYNLDIEGFASNSGEGSTFLTLNGYHSAQKIGYPYNQSTNTTKVITGANSDPLAVGQTQYMNGTYQSPANTSYAAGVNGTASGFATCGGRLRQQPAVSYGIQGTIKNMDGSAYPDPLKVRWYCDGVQDLDANPSFSGTKKLYGVVFVNSTQLAGQNGNQNSALHIVGQTLSDLGEDYGDYHLPANGPSWGALSIAHNDSQVLDAFTSGTWVATGASVVVGASYTSITATATTGKARRTFDYVNGEGYRYYRLRFRSNVGAAVPLTLRINSKTWNIVTGAAGGWVDVDIDTMAPDAVVAALPAQQDTRYPIHAANDERPLYEAVNWGVNYIDQLEVLDIPNGETIDLDEIKGVRLGHVRGGVLGAYPGSGTRLAWRSGPAEEYRVRHLFAEVDGRVALDAHASIGTITQLKTWIANNFPAWTLTDLVPSPTGGFANWFNNDLSASYLGGHHSVDGDDMSNLDLSAAKTIKAQFRFDFVRLHPGSGDPFTGEGYNVENYVYRTTHEKYMRGGAWGLATNDAGQPQGGALMQYRRQADGLPGGEGTTDSRGFFRTGLPFAVGTDTFEIVSGLTQLGSIRNTPRRWQNIGGRVTQQSRYLHLTRRESDGLLFESQVTTQGIRVVRYTGDGLYRIQFDADPSSAIQTAQIAVNGDDAPFIVFEEGGTVFYTASYSQGAYWTVPEPITTGTDPAPASDPRNGAEYVAIHKAGPDRWELWRHFGGGWLFISEICGGPRAKTGLEVAEDPAATIWFILDDGTQVRRFKSTSHGLFWTEDNT